MNEAMLRILMQQLMEQPTAHDDMMAALARMMSLRNQPQPEPGQEDWRNPGWFWHPEDTSYRPFNATENPDPKVYYRIDPGGNFEEPGLFHRGDEATISLPLGKYHPWDTALYKEIFPRLHKVNQSRFHQP